LTPGANSIKISLSIYTNCKLDNFRVEGKMFLMLKWTSLLRVS